MLKKGIKLVKFILMFVLVINIYVANTTKCYASQPYFKETLLEKDIVGTKSELDYWEPTIDNDDTELKNKIGVITSAIRTLGMIISIITLMVIGIKYMIGSVEEKAQYKQIMLPWIIGAIMVFAISSLPTIIYEISIKVFQ